MTTIANMPQQQPRAARGADPRGVLVFDGPLPDDLARQEDSTLVNDRDVARLHPRPRIRAATSAEIELLQHLGYQTGPGLETLVTWPSRACRRRTWPTLEGQQP